MTARSNAVLYPLSEFLPYLPYRPGLDECIDLLAAKLASSEPAQAEAQAEIPSSPEPAIKENRQGRIHPKVLCPSQPSPASNTTSRTTSGWDSFVVNSPLANQLPSPGRPPAGALPLPPSLMVSNYKPQRVVKRQINSKAPLGSEENPAELPGTTLSR